MSILADSYEAFLGALFLDKGYKFAQAFVESTLLIYTDKIIEEGKHKDAKSIVQEKAQEIFFVTPSYKVISESGPDHNKHFLTSIYFGEKKIAEGEGKSKQEAETNAAKAAIIKNNW